MTVCKHNCFVQKGSNETAFNWVIFSILCMSFDSSHNTLLYCVLLSWNSCAIFLFKTFTTSVFTPRDPVFETIFAHVFFRRRKNMLISHNTFLAWPIFHFSLWHGFFGLIQLLSYRVNLCVVQRHCTKLFVIDRPTWSLETWLFSPGNTNELLSKRQSQISI